MSNFHKNKFNGKVTKIVLLSVFVALVILLQVFVGSIKIGPVSFTLSLLPMVLCAVILGPFYGGVVGFAFSLVVLIYSITGGDAGGHMMFEVNPILTTIVIFLKGTLAGVVPGLIYKALSKRNTVVAVFISALSAPIVNTGIFLAFLILFYQETLNAWAGGSPVLTYVFSGIVLLNFIPETLVNTLLSPVILQVLRAFHITAKES